MADHAYSVQENSAKSREFDSAEVLHHSASAGTFTLRRALYFRKSPAWDASGGQPASGSANLGCNTLTVRT
jgi:hypothetical protein